MGQRVACYIIASDRGSTIYQQLWKVCNKQVNGCTSQEGKKKCFVAFLREAEETVKADLPGNCTEV